MTRASVSGPDGKGLSAEAAADPLHTAGLMGNTHETVT